MDEDELEAFMVDEIENGIGDTGVPSRPYRRDRGYEARGRRSDACFVQPRERPSHRRGDDGPSGMGCLLRWPRDPADPR